MNKEILRLALPNIVSNFSIPLLSTVDTALMGRLSADHIGAVGLGAMIFNMIYWNFGFLRMGTTGITAQAYGAQKAPQIIHTLIRAGSIALGLAIFLLLLQQPIGEASFFLMNIDSAQIDLVKEYFFIRILAAPATLMLYVLLGWFFGMQNAIFPLLVTIIINILNIAVSLYLIVEMGMEVGGVAWGTVIAQYCGLFLALILFYFRYGRQFVHIQREIVFNWIEIRGFLAINRDILIKTVFLTIAFAFFYAQSSKFGPELLAVNVVLQQFLSWISYGIDGFAFASESLVGKYKGIGDPKKLGLSIRLSFLWGFCVALCYSLIFYFYEDQLLRLFTNIESVLVRSKEYTIWIIIAPIFSFAAYIWDGIFVGLTASKAMRNSMMLAFLVYLASYYLIEPHYGNHGLWLALTIFLVFRALFQTYLFRRKDALTLD